MGCRRPSTAKPIALPPPNPPSSNFDVDFTSEKPTLTPVDREAIEQIDQSEFEGFEYCNPRFA